MQSYQFLVLWKLVFCQKRLKFEYSEKATNSKKNLPLKIWHYSVTSNFKWKIFSNFVAFSEYPNFTCSNKFGFKIVSLQKYRKIYTQTEDFFKKKWTFSNISLCFKKRENCWLPPFWLIFHSVALQKPEFWLP